MQGNYLQVPNYDATDDGAGGGACGGRATFSIHRLQPAIQRSSPTEIQPCVAQFHLEGALYITWSLGDQYLLPTDLGRAD